MIYWHMARRAACIINAGLNVVENWNGAQGFIFFGKGGEIAGNRLEEQELSVLALHLPQNCLIYVNTLMLQRILTEPVWLARMTPEDYRALTPAIHSHISAAFCRSSRAV